MIIGRLVSSSAGSGVVGTGDVAGPVSSTDNAIARFDGAGGKTIQNSTATLSDAGHIEATSVGLTGEMHAFSAHVDTQLEVDGSVTFNDFTSITDDLQVDGSITIIGAHGLVFEGTIDSFETTVAAVDPTADRTITFPDATGTVALVGGPMTSGYRALGDAGTTLVPATDCVLTFAPNGDTRTLTLASATAGQHFFVKNLPGSAENVDFTGGNIDGAAASSYSPIGAGVTIHLLCIGTTNFISLND